MQIGTSEAEPIWTEFLRKLTRRGLRGVKLVISDAHEGIKAAVPSLSNLPAGCSFAPRCPYAIPACNAAVPPLAETGDGQLSRCIRWQEI